MDERFRLLIETVLNSKGVEADYNKLKKWLEQDPARIKAVMDLSATKTEVNKFIKQFAPELQKMFSDKGLEVNIKDIESSLSSAFKTIQQNKNVIENINNKLSLVPTTIRNIETDFHKLIHQPDDLRQKIEQLNTSFRQLNNFSGTDEEKIKLYNKLKHEITGVKNEVQSLIKVQQQQVSIDDKQKLSSSIIDWSKKNTEAAKYFRKEIERIQLELQSADKTKFTALKKEFQSIQKQAEALEITGRTTFQELSNIITKFSSWYFTAGIVTSGTRTIKDMVNNVVELDANLVELQKVSDLTGQQLDKFIDKAYALGAQIARTGQEVIQASTEFKRAGYTLEESFELAEAALVMTNVGDGIRTVDAAASSLIATLKGFNMSATDAMKVVDMINETSNNAAIDFDNITEGLRRVSGTLAQAGVSIEQAIGLITGGFARLRDVEMVSSGILMVSQRLRGISEEGDKIVGLVPKLQRAFKEIAGIDIQDANGELRNTYDILSDMARIFPTLTSKQRQYLAELAAGNRQVKVLNAILDGWQDVEKAVESATNSQGSALRENEKFLDSIQGKLNAIRSSFEQLSQNTISSDFVKAILNLVNVLIIVADKVGLFNIALLATAGIIGGKGLVILLPKLAVAFGQLAVSMGLSASAAGVLGAALSTMLPVLSGLLIVGTIAKLYDELNVTLEEQQEITKKLKGEYESIQFELSSINDELKATNQRIEELNKKDKLTFVEKSELEKLKLVNEELTTTLNLLKLQEEETRKALADSLIKEFEKDFNNTSERKSLYKTQTAYGIGNTTYEIPVLISESEYIQEILTRYKELNQLKEQGVELSELQSIQYKNIREELIEAGNKYADYAKRAAEYGVDENIRKSWMDVATEINKTLDPNSYKQLSFDEVFNTESFIRIKEQLLSLAKVGELTEETISSNREYQRLLTETGLTAKEVTEQIYALSEQAEQSGKTVIKSLRNILDVNSESLDEYQQSLQKIQKALSSSDLSSSEITDLMQEFRDFDWGAYGVTGAKGVGNLTAALNALATQLKNDIVQVEGYNRAIEAMYEETITASIGAKDLSLVQDASNRKTKLSSEQIAYLTEKYSGLEKYLVKVKDGWYLEEKAITTVQTAIENLKSAYVNTQKEMTSIVETEAYKRLSAHGIVAAAMKSEYEFYQALASTPVDFSWKDIKEVSRIFELQKQFKDIFTTPPETKTGSGYEKEDPLLEELNYLKHIHNMGMADEEYYKKLSAIRNKMAKDYNTYKSQIWSIDEEIYKHNRDLQNKAIEDEFKLLEHRYNTGILTEKQYQEERWKLAQKYYKNNEEYADKWLEELERRYEYEQKYLGKSPTASITKLENQKKDVENTISEREAKGLETTEKQRQKIINLNNKLIDQYTVLKKKAEEELAILKPGTQAWEEKANEIQNYENTISSLIQENYSIEQEAIEKINKAREEYAQKLEKTLQDINKIFNRAISDLQDELDYIDEGSPDYFAKIAEVSNVAANQAKYLQEQIAKLNDEYKSGKINNEQYNELLEQLYDSLDDVNRVSKNLAKTMANAISASSKKVVDELAKSYENLTKAINDSYDAYEKIIKAKKESLMADREADKYAKDIAERNREIQKIQERMAELSIAAKTGDKDAARELKELQDELHEKQNDLTEKQIDYKIDQEEKALDKSLDLAKELRDKQLEHAKTVYETKMEQLKKLYDEEMKLVKSMVQYSSTEFGAVLSSIETRISTLITEINSLTGGNVTGIGRSLIGSIIDTQANLPRLNIVDSSGLTQAERERILYILKNGTGKDYGEDASRLAAYTRDMYGKPISKPQMLEIARILKVSGINSVDDITGNDVNKDRILAALQKAGFSRGGLVKATGEDGFALVKRDELIVNQVGTRILSKELAPLMKNFVRDFNLYKSKMPDISKITTSKTITPINIQIDSLLKDIKVASDYDLMNGIKQNLRQITNLIAKEIMNRK